MRWKTSAAVAGRLPRNGTWALAFWLAPPALAVLLSGCTTASRATADSIRQLVHRQPSYTTQQVLRTPYPQADVQTPDIRGLVVLGYVDDGQQVWMAGKHAVLRLSATGVLLSLRKQDAQYATTVEDEALFADLRSAADGTRVVRHYDRTPGYAMGVEVVGTIHAKGEDTVTVLDKRRTLLRFDEQLSGVDMRATNSYWVDPADGFIWKSRQFLAPDYPVDLVHLKPYRPAGR